jgi:hypothetical protein
MALKQHSSVKLGLRESFCCINSNSSSVKRSCWAVVTVISIALIVKNMRVDLPKYGSKVMQSNGSRPM